ncbi:MAG TPA: 3-deoxy-7-phosphoheptulonate synthase [Lentisphaeria bacterium]|nr:MAG: 3-deoxy-7-phosphoheptulonate synthase [Lentisphaerae bacterium GWF2_38_69]HBM15721.1 3-deoxy-7-phosphoheptulonate synthase [Lentisphaeria bacterium]
MIILLKYGANKTDADEIVGQIASMGLKPLYMPGVERTVIGAIGDERVLEKLHLENHPAVERVDKILTPYKLVSRDLYPIDTVVKIGNVPIGGGHFAVIAGPCAVESEEQMLKVAEIVKAHGGNALRGGAFKPRSSPYSFQGLGIEGLKILNKVSKITNLPTVTEVLEVQDVEAVEKYASAFQIGARNMQNFRLLKIVGQSKKPIILKRGLAATVSDLLLAAEYIVSEGNPNVILCERGIRTFETATRNTLDLNAIPYIKKHSHLPVIVDPSHGTGVRDFVEPMTKAAIACGADGVIIEVHNDPKNALSDGYQSLFPEQFASLMKNIRPFIQAANKK